MVESDGLENRYSGNAIEGSNPSLSAQIKQKTLTIKYMKVKNFLIITAAVFFLAVFTSTAKGQDDMDFEEFMGVMSVSMSDDQLDELSYQLPWDVKVYGYAYGDFSGDGKDDIILSVREKDVTPKNTVDVYVFENVDNTTYKLVSKKNYKYFDLTLEVAFLVKDGVCCITNRDNNNWYFTSYSINDNDELVQVDKDTFPIEFEKAGN